MKNFTPQDWYCTRNCNNKAMNDILGHGLTTYHYTEGEVYTYYPNDSKKYKTIYHGYSYKGCITEEFLYENFIKDSDGEILEEIDKLFDDLLTK